MTVLVHTAGCQLLPQFTGYCRLLPYKAAEILDSLFRGGICKRRQEAKLGQPGRVSPEKETETALYKMCVCVHVGMFVYIFIYTQIHIFPWLRPLIHSLKKKLFIFKSLWSHRQL